MVPMFRIRCLCVMIFTLSNTLNSIHVPSLGKQMYAPFQLIKKSKCKDTLYIYNRRDHFHTGNKRK